MQETTRTSEGLRSTLFTTLDRFLNGEIDHIQAKTTAKLADSILKSVAVDLEYKRLIGEMATKEGPQSVAALRLNIAMTADAFERGEKHEKSIDLDGTEIVIAEKGAPPAAKAKPSKAPASRLRKVLVIGLLPQQAAIIQHEFKDTFDIDFCTADDIRVIESKAPTHEVLMMIGFINHRASEIVKSCTANYSHIKGGVTALRDELTKMYSAM